LLGLNKRLEDRELTGNPIKVAIVGSGYMGSGILNVIEHMKGMKVFVLTDTDQKRAEKAYEDVGILKKDILHTNDVDEAAEAIELNKRVVTSNLRLPAETPLIDVVIDGTASPNIGAYVGFHAVTNKKHLVTANIEADVTIGHILKKLADSSGVVYTVIAGDEPAVIKELYDHADALGFEIIAAGKGKNNPLQVDATPETVAEKVPDIGISERQVASFVDGSKTMFEMACVANATGLVPDVRGMHGVKTKLSDLPKIFDLKEKGGILNQRGVVDYVLGGEVAPGVFLVITTKNVRLHSDLRYLKVGSGPNYVLYNPYHLWFIDAPLSVARAIFKKEPTIASEGKPRAEVVAAAKKPLKAGERLDGIGGYCVYGIIEKWEIAKKEEFLPHGLTENTRVIRDVNKGEILRYEDVQLEDSVLVELRKLQEKLFK